jgi:hypothetical protein
MLSASEPDPVKQMHSGRDAPTMRAIVSLDSSSTLFASRPAEWIEDALPYLPLR